MNHLIVTPTALFFAVALVTVAFFISLKEKIGLEKDLVIGVIRAVIQLTIVGYVLTYIISVNRAWLTLLMVAIIVFNAAWNARGRARGIPHAFVISLLAIAVATGGHNWLAGFSESDCLCSQSNRTGFWYDCQQCDGCDWFDLPKLEQPVP